MSDIKNIEEIPKYRKKTGSNKSKSKEKSKHKHHYVECFVTYDFTFGDKTNRHIGLSSYCDVCGKLGSSLEDGAIRSLYHDKREGGYIIPWSNKMDEIYEKHKNEIPTFHLNDMFSKYVDISTLNKKGE